MNKILKRVAFVAAVLLAPSVAQAQAVDQYNYGNDGPSGPFLSAGYSNTSLANTFFGQWFVPQQNNIVGARILLFNSSATESKSFTLYGEVHLGDDDSFITDGNTFFPIIPPNTYFIAPVSFTPASVTPTELYYMVYLVDTMDPDVHYIIDTDNNYAPANAFWFSDTEYADIEGDMVFEELYEEAATPEPASMILLATGLFGVVGVARRRRNNVA